MTQKAVSRYNNAALIALYIFILECTVGGAGRIVSFGHVSLRMIIFSIAFAMTLPDVIRKFKSLVRIGYLHVLALFFAVLVAAAAYGLIRGNSRSFIASDLSSFLTLLLLPGAMATLDTRERREFAVGIVMWGSLAVALFTCIVHVISPIVPQTFLNNLSDIFYVTRSGSLTVYSQEFLLYRVYLKSQMFLPLGTLLFLRKAVDTPKRFAVCLFSAGVAVELYAAILSFTRGFWLGSAVACLLFLVFVIREKAVKLISVFALVLAFVVLLFGISALVYRSNVTFEAVMNRIGLTIGTAPAEGSDAFSEMVQGSEEGDDIREKTLDALYAHLRSGFLTGYGLGANLDGVRTEGKTEYTYLDMIMKLGTVGFIVFIWVTMWHALRVSKDSLRRLFWRKKEQHSPDPEENGGISLTCVLAWGYIGMLISSIWNPFLLSPMGMLMLILLAVVTENGKTGSIS